MTYEQLRELWTTTLRASRLQVHGAHDIDETLDARTLDRTVSSIVASPLRAEPFTATATFAWRWTALHTARTITTEEDLLAEVLRRDHATRSHTRRPHLRLDIGLRATLPWGAPLALPLPAVWAAWARAVMRTLETHVPLVPAERARETRRGDLEVLAGLGEPTARVACARDGALLLTSIGVDAWQLIDLARVWSDPDRRPDPEVGPQLAAMFTRVGAALDAWARLTGELHGLS